MGKAMRKISITVTAQTAWNLRKLASMCGYRQPGHVVDKLVREKMIWMQEVTRTGGTRGGKGEHSISGHREKHR